MRRGRSFIVLLIVALGLGAYAYFVESKRETSDAPATKSESVWTIDTSKAERLDVKAANGDVTTLEKKGDQWEITAPEPALADQAAVSSLLSSLSALQSTRVVDEHPADAKPFELDPARISVAVRLSGESEPRAIEIGMETPTGSDLYARVKGQPRIFLVSSSLESQLNRTPFDLRDKTVLKFDQPKVDTLELSGAASPSVSLARKTSDQWRLTQPVDAEADFSAVDGILSKLTQAQIKSVVTNDGTKDTKKYGLDRPQATVTLGAGSARATLILGSKSPDGGIYARDLTRPAVFTVEESLLEDLEKRPDDLRRKMLFEFRSYNAWTVDITHGSESFSFTKQAPPPQPNQAASPETWKQTKPASRDVDQTKMTDFLVDLANLKADSFAERALASGDEYVVAVKFGDEKAPTEERVTFRKSGSTIHALRQGEPGAAVVATADFDKALAGLTGVTEGK